MKKLMTPLKRYAIIAYILCIANPVFAQIETITLSASKTLEEALQEIGKYGCYKKRNYKTQYYK